jgi:hypothetical protein
VAEVTIYAEQDGGGLGVGGSTFADLLTRTEANGTDYSTATGFNAKIDATYNEVYQILFRFDTSSLSGATINDVTLNLTTDAWAPGGWGGVAAGAVEAYVISDVISDGYDRSDLVSVAEAQSLYSGGNLAATSPYDAGGNPASYVRDWEWASDADFPDLLNLSGYTCMVLIPSNWRTETETTQGWGVFTQHHATEAYRPRLVVDYTEGGGGGVPKQFDNYARRRAG